MQNNLKNKIIIILSIFFVVFSISVSTTFAKVKISDFILFSKYTADTHVSGSLKIDKCDFNGKTYSMITSMPESDGGTNLYDEKGKSFGGWGGMLPDEMNTNCDVNCKDIRKNASCENIFSQSFDGKIMKDIYNLQKLNLAKYISKPKVETISATYGHISSTCLPPDFTVCKPDFALNFMGKVDGQKSATKVWAQYWSKNSVKKQTTPHNLYYPLKDAKNEIAVSANPPDGIYRYRIVAKNAAGITYGKIKEIKVNSVKKEERYVGDGCKVVSGCNGPIECVDLSKDTTNFVTTCEYRQEYECYKAKTARCEKQTNGSCGWTENEELKMCKVKAKESLQTVIN